MSSPETPADAPQASWSARYDDRHRWRRFDALPAGTAPPRKVRVYQRAEHFLLNWWDPGERKSLSERVAGDLLAALTRAREIDDRVAAHAPGTAAVVAYTHLDRLRGRYAAALRREWAPLVATVAERVDAPRAAGRWGPPTVTLAPPGDG